nr:unnamed protein product [Callosobruchus analis]
MKVLNIRFKEIEKALNFNGDKMEELQEDLRSVIEENKQMKKEQEQLKSRIKDLEKEVVTIKNRTSKSVDETWKKNIILTAIKGNKDVESNVKRVLTKLSCVGFDFKASAIQNKDSAIIVVQFANEHQKKMMYWRNGREFI